MRLRSVPPLGIGVNKQEASLATRRQTSLSPVMSDLSANKFAALDATSPAGDSHFQQETKMMPYSKPEIAVLVTG